MTCIKCNHGNAQRFGTYGKRKIQRYRCTSCKITFCEPHPSVGTHCIAPEKVAGVLSLMMEGTSLRAITRLMEIDLKTVLSLLETAGRCHLRRFVRRTNAHSRKLANLRFAVHIFMAWFCLCRVHQTLRVTPAMEAGITDHVWGLEELLAIC